MTTNELDLTAELEQFKRESDQSVKLVTEAGIVVDTAQWLTIKRYAQRYNLTTQVVTNWLSRGVIPEGCTMVLPELNDLRLVKDQPYK